VAIATWLGALVSYAAARGVPVDRPALILWTITGLLAACVGRRPLWSVLRDWMPFAGLLVVYDLSRGAADALGRPTLWTPQLDLDRRLFFGTEPTVWLQSHLKATYAPWWEVVVSTTYVSYFLAPYLLAGVLWLCRRDLWRRFVIGFVAINLAALAVFIAFPAAPPWAAGQCTAADVADHSSDPPCLHQPNRLADNGLLGPLHNHHPGSSIYVERIGVRGFERHGLPVAASLVNEGRADVNDVAAVPSLHAALSLFLAIFLWPLARRRWRPLLAAYPLVMAFSLVYSAEHYVVDILAGWLLTGVVSAVTAFARARRRAKPAPGADRLEVQPATRPA
ncbi:MAG: phosphatase PAP2 family protein, partial [Actinomycetota bacterium]|nr:phosphatase PAP2 family protein [Actinomycetota bacterium]